MTDSQHSQDMDQDDDSAEVVLSMTLGQARALAKAADLYTRLCIGKLEQVSELVRADVLPSHSDTDHTLAPASVRVCSAVERLMIEAKVLLGYPPNGGPSIGNPNVHLSAHRTWEVCTVLNKALADHRDPNPVSRGPHHYGLGTLRYTSDKAPTAVVRKAQPSQAPHQRSHVPPQ